MPFINVTSSLDAISQIVDHMYHFSVGECDVFSINLDQHSAEYVCGRIDETGHLITFGCQMNAYGQLQINVRRIK
jgi:hypothetical protein